jgi:hypothetical protein
LILKDIEQSLSMTHFQGIVNLAFPEKRGDYKTLHYLSCSLGKPAEVGVRKRFCQAMIQQAVFTNMIWNKSAIREGLRFWTDLLVAGNYT